jgi:hypothetical protein
MTYDSGSGNDPFGFGWCLSLPSITRKTDKGLPQYLGTVNSDIFILSSRSMDFEGERKTQLTSRQQSDYQSVPSVRVLSIAPLETQLGESFWGRPAATSASAVAASSRKCRRAMIQEGVGRCAGGKSSMADAEIIILGRGPGPKWRAKHAQVSTRR